ncbi:hypothetical protein TBLA_0A05740 [Henningerozyma blattae CBS 6284]|uniref:Diphthamide biosynthesis protein 4 n=1 Tax=Henningerozyma blattae (strain ATCC 34711 / CBS 6284 / DSM 70876 / NBRC 10599 / NRRL Y-10934 / UCD 77-7) TaxID=1071380 RepID=I2GW65_HENB6|nr:hypothetical protein TBLA_0A05740 [Tetrapisispora blattae CBS 6284]CCH58367.1 hypothetical protein TBLA_0A05740 [Tetrapisispora blattae CBS 6284]
MSLLSHYEILGIDSDATESDIKRAYKEKLLAIHPDKIKNNAKAKANTNENITGNENKSPISVNHIQDAYKILVDSKSRQQYDKELEEQFKKMGFFNNGDGVEEISLDEFEWNEKNEYRLNCPRCKQVDGFEFDEDALEEYGYQKRDSCEYLMMIQCNSCSLWIKVAYEMV